METRPGGGVDLFPRPPFRRVHIADARESSDTDEYESEDPERRSTRQPPVANPAQESVSTDDSSGDDASTSSWSEYEEEDLSTQRSPSPGTPTSSGTKEFEAVHRDDDRENGAEDDFVTYSNVEFQF